MSLCKPWPWCSWHSTVTIPSRMGALQSLGQLLLYVNGDYWTGQVPSPIPSDLWLHTCKEGARESTAWQREHLHPTSRLLSVSLNLTFLLLERPGDHKICRIKVETHWHKLYRSLFFFTALKFCWVFLHCYWFSGALILPSLRISM